MVSSHFFGAVTKSPGRCRKCGYFPLLRGPTRSCGQRHCSEPELVARSFHRWLCPRAFSPVDSAGLSLTSGVYVNATVYPISVPRRRAGAPSCCFCTCLRLIVLSAWCHCKPDTWGTPRTCRISPFAESSHSRTLFWSKWESH